MSKTFPPQEYTRYNGSSSEDYIGTWRKDIAFKIAKELRQDGFIVNLLGRGHRTPPANQANISHRLATHIAIYIRDAKFEVTKYKPYHMTCIECKGQFICYHECDENKDNYKICICLRCVTNGHDLSCETLKGKKALYKIKR